MKKGEKLSPEEKAKFMDNRKVRGPRELKILQLTDELRLISDKIQYTIERFNTEKNRWEFDGKYHTRLDWAVTSLSKMVPKENLAPLIYVVEQLDRIEKIVSDYANLDKIKIHDKL